MFSYSESNIVIWVSDPIREVDQIIIKTIDREMLSKPSRELDRWRQSPANTNKHMSNTYTCTVQAQSERNKQKRKVRTLCQLALCLPYSASST